MSKLNTGNGFVAFVNIFRAQTLGTPEREDVLPSKGSISATAASTYLMKDKYIEDIDCNGSDIFLYIQHRMAQSVQYLKSGEVHQQLRPEVAPVGGRHISYLQPNP